MIAESSDYDVMEVSEVFASQPVEASGSGDGGVPLPVVAEEDEEDLSENIRAAEESLGLPLVADEVIREEGSSTLESSTEKRSTLVSEETLGSEDPAPGSEPLLGSRGRFMKKEEYKVRTIIQAVPMRSKKGPDVLAAMQELYMRFLRYGYPVYRIHTDSGKEFVNKRTKEWAANRGLVFTRSCPDEHQQNGRAEAAIGSLKSRIRRLLHAARLCAVAGGREACRGA